MLTVAVDSTTNISNTHQIICQSSSILLLVGVLPVLSLDCPDITIMVDLTLRRNQIRAQELCNSWGGHLGLPVPNSNSPFSILGRATQKSNSEEEGIKNQLFISSVCCSRKGIAQKIYIIDIYIFLFLILNEYVLIFNSFLFSDARNYLGTAAALMKELLPSTAGVYEGLEFTCCGILSWPYPWWGWNE